MNQMWKRHGMGALVTCTFVVLVLMGTASGRQTVYVNCSSTTVTAGVQAVIPGGEVIITGACPEALTINKPLTLKAQGPDTVMIGPSVGGGTPARDHVVSTFLIAQWSDPLTLPQCTLDGLDFTCRHMINRWYLHMDTSDYPVEEQDVLQCFQNALISGAVSAIWAVVTDGAALPAAVSSIVSSMGTCLGINYFAPRTSFSTWSSWE
jgi:hypothetical protein